MLLRGEDTPITKLRLSSEGKVLLLLLLGFAAGALNTGTNLLYFLTGLLLNMFLINAWVASRGLRRLSVERRLPERAVRGKTVKARYTLGGRIRLALRVEEESPLFAAGSTRICLLGIEERAEVELDVRLRWCGLHQLGPLLASTRAPFGLVEATRRIDAPGTVLVVPSVHPVRSRILHAPATAAETLARRLQLGAERRDVVRSLREHREGDDARAIHWRSTARRGQLVVKDFERTHPDEALVILELGDPDPHLTGRPRETIEAALSLAASLFSALQGEGLQTGLAVAADGAPRFLAPQAARRPSLDRALRILAMAKPVPRPDLSALLRVAAHTAQHARLIVVTTAAQADRRHPRLARARVLRVADRSDVTRWFARPEPPVQVEVVEAAT